jgi:hypothetical protein
VTRDFWLIDLKNFNKETDTQFLLPNQVDEPQTCPIRERFKEQFYVVTLVCHELLGNRKTVILSTICAFRLFLSSGIQQRNRDAFHPLFALKVRVK